MSTVYLAEDPLIERQVALKLLASQFVSDAELRARFKREAKVIAALDHAYIVPVFEFGEADEQLYFAMRSMAGGTLADRVGRGPLPLDEATHIVERLAQALDAAHQRGIIHRDLKPGNVLFDAQGEAYLSDFGIAKVTGSGTVQTMTGVLGTPQYMSPEQVLEERELDARSDVYSLGIIVYYMLAGQAPYNSDTPMRVMYRHIHDPVPRLDTQRLGLPPKINKVLARAMAKRPDDRYSSAGELAAAMRALTGQARPPSPTLTLAITTVPKKEIPAQVTQTSSTASTPTVAHSARPRPLLAPPTWHAPRRAWIISLVSLPVIAVMAGLGMMWVRTISSDATPTPTLLATATLRPTRAPPTAGVVVTKARSPTATLTLTASSTATSTASATATRRRLTLTATLPPLPSATLAAPTLPPNTLAPPPADTATPAPPPTNTLAPPPTEAPTSLPPTNTLAPPPPN